MAAGVPDLPPSLLARFTCSNTTLLMVTSGALSRLRMGNL